MEKKDTLSAEKLTQLVDELEKLEPSERQELNELQNVSPHSTSPNQYCTKQLLELIRDVIKDVEVPTWFNTVPANFGEASAGTLKADEWCSYATVYLPLALVKAWGVGSTHASDAHATEASRALESTMHLVAAVTLACYRRMSKDRARAYRDSLVKYFSDLTTVFPHRAAAHFTPNCHAAMHIYDFLLLFGPVHSWWTYPYERLIGIIQRMGSNHKFGRHFKDQTIYRSNDEIKVSWRKHCSTSSSRRQKCVNGSRNQVTLHRLSFVIGYT